MVPKLASYWILLFTANGLRVQPSLKNIDVNTGLVLTIALWYQGPLKLTLNDDEEKFEVFRE